MKTIVLLTILAVLPFAAQADQVITLKDGSQLHGDLVSVSNGVYTIKTATMGQVTLNAQDVSNISNGATNIQVQTPTSSVNVTTNSNATEQKFQQMQSQLMANPAALAEIQEMAKDPEVMQLLSDPALIQSVTSHDVNAIQGNPKAQELMKNPKMQALMAKIQASQQQQQ